MFADFHLHSNCSDGRLDAAALVDCIADAGIEIFALTDHDTTAGHDDAKRRAGERGLRFVPGIEMTSYDCGRVIHVLGLGCDGSDAALRQANAVARTVWDHNQRHWIAALTHAGLNVDFDRDFPDHPVRLPVLIERLCRRGLDGGDPVAVHARFRAFFAALPLEAYAALPSPARCAHVIRRSGGAAFLAHPASLHESGLAEALLADMDGLEATYLAYSPHQQADLRALALKHGKLYSGGSDYHGYFESSYRAPDFEANAPLLERLGYAKAI